MPTWVWDPDQRVYRQSEGGLTLGERQLRPALRLLLQSQTERSRELTGQLANNLIAVPEWEFEMRRVVKDAFGSSYLLSRGGRNAMQPSDWGRLGAMVKRQYRYLNQYAQDIAAAGLTRDRALARSDLYITAGRQSYQRGKLATYSELPRIPRVPGDGSTSCLVSCRCELEIEDTNSGWNVYWLDLGDDRECQDCRGLAVDWAPLQLSRAARSAEDEDE
jgi:hypothetical protein